MKIPVNTSVTSCNLFDDICPDMACGRKVLITGAGDEE